VVGRLGEALVARDEHCAVALGEREQESSSRSDERRVAGDPTVEDPRRPARAFRQVRRGNPPFMGIGASLVLIAVGAILIWAVNADVSGVELTTVGWILLIVGIAGALLSVIFWSSWGGVGGRRRDVVYDDRLPPA
jgi:hypothetical protein